MIIQNLPTEGRVKLHVSSLTSIRFFFVSLLKKFALQLLKSRGKFGILEFFAGRSTRLFWTLGGCYVILFQETTSTLCNDKKF